MTLLAFLDDKAQWDQLKEFSPLGANSFLLELTPIQKDDKNIGSYFSCMPTANWQPFLQGRSLQQ